MFTNRGPLGVVADAIARGVDRLTKQKADPLLQFITDALPVMPAVIQALKPCPSVDLDGPKVKQLRYEFAAEEASLKAAFAEKRARLVAKFGSRFDEALAADDAHYASRNRADLATVDDGEAASA
jgi:hypothetical protein